MFDILKASRGGYVERQESGECAEHGTFAVRVYCEEGREVGRFPSSCLVCQRIAEELAAKAADEADLASRIVSAGVPARFRGCMLRNYVVYADEQRDLIRLATEFADAYSKGIDVGRSLILLGRPGTGKTHIAAALLRAVLRSRRSGRYTTVADFVRHVRSTWGPRATAGETELQVIRGYAETSLLVLDEVGASFGSESEVGMLADLIDQRYRAQRPTIIIGNVTIEELKRYLGDRSMDRLRDNDGRVVVCDWQSYRGRSPELGARNNLRT